MEMRILSDEYWKHDPEKEVMTFKNSLDTLWMIESIFPKNKLQYQLC